MTDEDEKPKIIRAVARAERFCPREKAIALVALNTNYSIAEIRAAADEASCTS